MKKFEEYLEKRIATIKSNLEIDVTINADRYHNVGLLKEVEKIKKLYEKERKSK